MSNSHFAQRARETEYPAPSPAARHDDQHTTGRILDLDLSAVSQNDISDCGKLRCVPGEGQLGHVFHWLVFLEGKDTRAGCDLWRWHRGEWRSVFVAGAIFSPEDMYAQGWRYCAPSVPPFVNIIRGAKMRLGEAGRADSRATHPGVSGTATMQPKRNRMPAVALPPPAWPRPAGPLRRAAAGSV